MEAKHDTTAAPTPLSRALDTVKKLRAQLDEAGGSQPLAIVGTGLRFPGGIDDLDSYWQALSEGRDLVRPLPQERKGPFAEEWDRLPHRGGFLDEVLDFDASFFGMGEAEASALDPQHRLLLEVAWEALENAALPADRLDGARTGLFVGIMNHDWWHWLDGDPDRHWTTGNGHYFAAGRLAYELGLGGPAIAVDTACSSSLVSVHLARQALSRKECDVALAGGVNLALSPHMTKQLDALGSLAPDAKCKSFDARANGFPRGEGCGVIVLKRLADAQRDGDRVLGVLKGSAVNQYGRSTGFTAPNVLSLIGLMESALSDAGLTPADIGLVEAHGTGTSLGDTIEMEAIVSVLGRKNGGARLPVGSVKANLGHTESAAGIAALLKALACLRHRAVPPLAHFSTLNPLIDLDGTGVTLPTELTPWPQGTGGRHVAVSAFSMGGTNAHLLLGPAEEGAPAADGGAAPVAGFELSAKSPEAVRELAGRLRGRLAGLSDADYPAFAYTVTTGRARHKWLAAVTAADRESALTALAALAEGRAADAVALRERDGDAEPGAGFGELPRAVLDLPSYPWQRQRYAPGSAARAGAATGAVPALAAPAEAAPEPAADAAPSPAVEETEGTRALHEVTWREAPDGGAPRAAADAGWWLLFADRTGLAEELAEQIAHRSGSSVTVTAGRGFQRLSDSRYEIDPLRQADLTALLDALRADRPGPCAGVVHAWSLDSPAPDDGAADGTGQPPAWHSREAGRVSARHLVQELAQRDLGGAPRLTLLTRGAQPVTSGDSPNALAQAPLWGLAGQRAARPGAARPALIDLDPAPADGEAARLLDELLRTGGPERLALRGTSRQVPALVAHGTSQGTGPAWHRRPFDAAKDENLRVLAARPGILTSLEPTLWRRTPPGPGQVEIEVGAAALNFSDVLKAMDAYPGASGTVPLGIECAGRISAVGEGVEGHRVGDPVMAVVTSGLAAYATTEAHLVAPRPEALTDEQAAATPVAFLTAVYGLEYLARLRRGEKVLIHSATGGVGLAALMVARRCGAEVFATAGTEDKRRLLRELGLPADHVMDSRSLAFADRIGELTGGYGVDVVLNSVTGEALVRSLGLLAPGGRFVEIGKRDIYDDNPIGLGFFKDNRSLFAVDLEKTLWERPRIVAELFEEVAGGFKSGQFEALPVKSFPYAEAPAAFARMAQAQHTGKLVLTPRGDEAVAVPSGPGPVRSGATYLVAGAADGAHLAAARQLAEAGARHLALLGGEWGSGEAAEALAELRSRHVEAELLAADPSGYDAVAAAVARIGESMPPLAGVVYADGGRAAGAWNLHRATLERELDLFVLVSAGDAAGQGVDGGHGEDGGQEDAGRADGIGAGALLDSLALHRRWRGLPALSVDAGALASLGRLLGAPSAAVRVLEPDPAAVAAIGAAAPGAVGAEGDGGEAIRGELLALEPGRRRRNALVRHCRELAARVLRADAGALDPAAPLASMGFDSMRTLELRSRMEASMGIKLPATVGWRYPTLDALVPFLAERMDIALEAGPASPPADGPGTGPAPGARRPAPPTQPLVADRDDEEPELDELSDSEIEALLLAKTEQLDEGRQG